MLQLDDKAIWDKGGSKDQEETLNPRDYIQVTNDLYSTIIDAFSGMAEGVVDERDNYKMEIYSNE